LRQGIQDERNPVRRVSKRTVPLACGKDESERASPNSFYFYVKSSFALPTIEILAAIVSLSRPDLPTSAFVIPHSRSYCSTLDTGVLDWCAKALAEAAQDHRLCLASRCFSLRHRLGRLRFRLLQQ